MKKLLLFFGASILLSFFACDKADKTDLHFIEYNLKNETDYYVQVNTSFLTSAGFYSPSYSGYRGLDINYYDKEFFINDSVICGDGLQAVFIPQPLEYDTYSQKIDTIYPKKTVTIKIPIWDNHYRELPPYDSLENVTVIEKQYNKVVYSGKGYYCNSIDNSRIANKIDIRFIGKFCTGEYNNNKLVLNQTDKPNFEKTITETLDADYSKNIIFK